MDSLTQKRKKIKKMSKNKRFSKPSPSMIAEQMNISESDVSINDNEISSLQHHLEDAIKAIKDGSNEVLMSSLHDIKEIIDKLIEKLPSTEKKELNNNSDWQMGND